LGQQVPGFRGRVRSGAGNPGQGKGQQSAGIGDDEKALVLDGNLLEAGFGFRVSGVRKSF
jgi:hypothetical protein